MFKKVLTITTAMVAVGGAFVGNADARNLLVATGWVRASDNTPIASTEAALQECPGSEVSCAYYFESVEDTEPAITLHKDLN